MKTERPRAKQWDDVRNEMRCALIDKACDDNAKLSDAECVELALLQTEMLIHRRKVAPLPLARLRKIHRELLRKVGKANE